MGTYVVGFVLLAGVTTCIFSGAVLLKRKKMEQKNTVEEALSSMRDCTRGVKAVKATRETCISSERIRQLRREMEKEVEL